MGSGSQLIPTEARAAARALPGGGALLLGLPLLCALALASSCSAAKTDFPKALAAIDALALAPVSGNRASLEDRQGRAYAAAYRAASSSSNWLSLMKRAAASGGERSLECVGKALEASPGSEPVAKAAAYLYLRNGLPEAALALFSGPPGAGGVETRAGRSRPLAFEDRPRLWAEAYLSARREKRLPPGLELPEASARLAALFEEPAFLTEAALLALGKGERFAASSYLRAALDQGASPPEVLLWDAGLPAELSARAPALPDQGESRAAESIAAGPLPTGGAAERLLEGDAALLAGDPELARKRWAFALELDPLASWKALAKLALFAADRDSALLYARRLARDFPSNEAALRFAAAFLFGQGREEEARGLLSASAPGEGAGASSAELELLRLSLEGLGGPEDRLLAEVLRLLEKRPDSPIVREAALRLLLERRRYGDYLTVFDSGEARGLGFKNHWYYSAVALALRGDFNRAAELLEKEAPAIPGPEGAFALGLVYSELGYFQKALELLEVARGAARSPREKAAVFKEIGRNQGRLGESSAARAAYRAAALADPEDSEAAFLAESK